MLNECAAESSACVAYLRDVRDWMKANPQTFGPLCDEPPAELPGGRRTVTGKEPEALARLYWHVRVQSWFPKASARDAAVWVIQGQLACELQRIKEPGEPGFPSVLTAPDGKY